MSAKGASPRNCPAASTLDSFDLAHAIVLVEGVGAKPLILSLVWDSVSATAQLAILRGLAGVLPEQVLAGVA
jgi:hypothetical protein